MKLVFDIALRFLLTARQSRSLKLFTIISIGGIACSVMLFLLIDSVIHGMFAHLEKSLTGFDAPIVLTLNADEIPQAQTDFRSFNRLHNQDLKLSAISQFEGLIEVSGQTPIGLRVRSVSQDYLKRSDLNVQIFWDEGYNDDVFANSPDLILLGEQLYQKLQFVPGVEQQVYVTNPFADLGPSGDIEPVSQMFRVAGIFNTGRTELDDAFALISYAGMSTVSNPILTENQLLIHAFFLDAEFLKTKLLRNFPQYEGKLQTWLDRNAHLLKAMRLERLVYAGVFVFVMMVSCFNLAGVVAIFAISKAREAALLKTLGLTRRNILGVFSLQGIVMGSVGAIFGVVMALTVMALFKYSAFSLPHSYGFTELPILVRTSTILTLLLGTPAVCLVVSYFPAKRFAASDIIETLRLS